MTQATAGPLLKSDTIGRHGVSVDSVIAAPQAEFARIVKLVTAERGTGD